MTQGVPETMERFIWELPLNRAMTPMSPSKSPFSVKSQREEGEGGGRWSLRFHFLPAPGAGISPALCFWVLR